MEYNNSAKAKMERVAADEKDKGFASKKGVKKLDNDIEDMVNGKTSVANMHGKTHGGAKMYDKAPKMYGKSKGPKMESNAQEKKNLLSDNPIASRASGGSWMSKHTKSKM